MTLDEAIDLDHSFRSSGGREDAAFVFTRAEWQDLVREVRGTGITIHPASVFGNAFVGRPVWIAENIAAPPVNSVCTAAAKGVFDGR